MLPAIKLNATCYRNGYCLAVVYIKAVFSTDLELMRWLDDTGWGYTLSPETDNTKAPDPVLSHTNRNK